MKKTIQAISKALLPIRVRSILESIYKRAYYIGFRYECPFCNSNLRAFLPYGLDFPVLKEKNVVGGGYRLNALCPVCGSVDRERLLYLFLMRKTDLFKRPLKLLHVAPEKRVEEKLRNLANIDYLTADLYSESVMVKVDITSMQFPDSTFDAIICNHVLEHIVDDRRAMRELHRTLKPRGWAILQVPVSLSQKNTYEDTSIKNPHDREQAFGQSDHVRLYARDYKDRLDEIGFLVHVFQWVAEHENFGGLQNRFGLNKEESVYLVIKTH